MAKTPVKARKKVKKNITSGIAHVNSTFNNTLITILQIISIKCTKINKTGFILFTMFKEH